MKFQDINNIDDLVKYCNMKSKKNMKSYTKPTSPLPHLILSHHTSPSGSISVIKLAPVSWNVKDDVAKPRHLGGVKYLIFSYDSLIGCVFNKEDKLYIIDPDEYKTTRTTQKILSHLISISDYILDRYSYCSLLDIFKLYTYCYLKYKGDMVYE